MVGLDQVKQHLGDLVKVAALNAEVRAQGGKVPEQSMHLVFEGPPGTGKTTAARHLAEAYKAAGLTKTDKVVEVSARDLVSKFQSGSQKRTKNILNKARGGVLFIDEMYSLVNSDADEGGREALNQLVKMSEDRRNDTVIIMAGYSADQNGGIDYLSSFNPGLKSRFPTRIQFTDYKPKELGEIAVRQAKTMELKPADPDAEKALRLAGGKVKGNARGVRSLMEKVWVVKARRLAEKKGRLTSADYKTYSVDDVKDALAEYKASS